MGSSMPKPMKTPYENRQQEQINYAPQSIADTPEAKSFLDVPLDFGGDVDVDPSVGRRTDLAEQEIGDRYDSAFMSGVPSYIRQANRAKELRDVRGQGAYEGQQARFFNQQGNNQTRQARTLADLERRQMLLPQLLSTGGTSNASGFGTQIVQPQPGFLQRLLLAGVSGGSQVASAYAGRG